MVTDAELTEKIIKKAKSLGASIVGVTSLKPLRESPSHLMYPKIGMNLDVHWRDMRDSDTPPDVVWPADAVSAVVIGVAHDADEPELDWWDGQGTAGNRILMQINAKLSEWIERTLSVKTYKLSYFYEKGGVFLKDAAVMAGLGCIGKNNLVITPEYGPRIRFRALLLNREAQNTSSSAFYPCEDCNQPCRQACPVKAFQRTIYYADVLEQSVLPGINGTYDRGICNEKMEADIEEAVMETPVHDTGHQNIKAVISNFEEGGMAQQEDVEKPMYCVKYCRRCELSCPVGK